VLWVCVLLFVVSGTLLSTGAGLPKFAISPQEWSSGGPSSGAGQVGAAPPSPSNVWNGITVGAFTALYFDDGNSYTSYIDDSCTVDWEAGFTDGLFESGALCTQFKAFRSLLIVAIVFVFLIALILYTAILLRWLPPSATQDRPSVPYLALTLSLLCLVPVAANAASVGLMVQLVFNGFIGATIYGVSFKLMAAALPLSFIGSALLALDCAYHHYWSNTRSSSKLPGALPAGASVTRGNGAVDEGTEEGVAMAEIKQHSTPLELTGIHTAA
jgi:hypothetical protein